MPKTKQTTKDKDLPESVQWLLDFANLACKQGTPNPGNIFGESSTLKRPPSEPGTPTKVHSSTGASGLIIPGLFKEYDGIDKTKKKSDQEILKSIFGDKTCNHKTPQYYSDINGNYWVKYPDKEPILIGTMNDNPTPKQFRSFFSKTGVADADDRIQIWIYTNMCLRLKIKNNFDKDESVHHFMRVFFAEAFVTNRYDEKQIQLPVLGVRYEDSLCNGLKYSHDNTLSQVACAYILDFWHNQYKLHPDLRQCNCCGKFYFIFEEEASEKYCYYNMCGNRFNQPSRLANKDSQASSRKWKRLESKKEIVNWLYSIGIPKEEALERYEEEKKAHPKNVASLRAFQKSSRYNIDYS